MKVINVASVPQRSPFRYAGGKTWLVPYLRLWLPVDGHIETLIEPFAGGGVISLTTGFEARAKSVLMVEKDIDVAAVWETIISLGQGTQLANRILHFDLTSENVASALSRPPKSLLDRAFVTILRNRVQRGGILAPGAGLMKNGENGKGLKSRWYPETLHARIVAIHEKRNLFKFRAGDAFTVIKKNLDRTNVAFFIDPPYTVAGKRLYFYSDVDHKRLFKMMSEAKGKFLMTYDNADEIRRLADKYAFEYELVPMKNTHHESKMELFIGRSLEWLRSPNGC